MATSRPSVQPATPASAAASTQVVESPRHDRRQPGGWDPGDPALHLRPLEAVGKLDLGQGHRGGAGGEQIDGVEQRFFGGGQPGTHPGLPGVTAEDVRMEVVYLEAGVGGVDSLAPAQGRGMDGAGNLVDHPVGEQGAPRRQVARIRPRQSRQDICGVCRSRSDEPHSTAQTPDETGVR
jgi:hypothetical protein